MKPYELSTPAWARALAGIIIAAMLSSCAHLNPPAPEPQPEPEPVAVKKPPPEPIKPPPPSQLYDWWGKDYVSLIEVSINEQKARLYSGDEMVGWTTVASGLHKYPTPTGNFAIINKVKDKKSNLYGKIYNKNGKLVRRNAKMGVHPVPAGGRFKGAPMPYFLRLTNDGIGLHGGPIPHPGNRASHGCIRMPKNFAPILYNHVNVGTRVIIKGNGPSYSTYLAKQRRSAPAPAKTAVVKAETAPAHTPTAASEAVAAGSVTASGQPAISQDTSAGASATPPFPRQPAAAVAPPAPSAPATAPATPSTAGTTTYTAPNLYPQPSPVPGSSTAVSGMTGMAAPPPRITVTPIKPPPAAQPAPVTGLTGAPVASPAQSIPAEVPAPAAVSPAPQPTPTPSPSAGMTGAPSQSTGGQQPPSPTPAAPSQATPSETK